MNCRHTNLNSNQTNQKGVSIMVAMVMLLVLTLLGVSSMNSSIVELKIATSKQQQGIALNRAEELLRVSETNIDAILANPAAFDFASAGDGYYVTASYLLSGEHRELTKGKLRSVKPGSDSGAWELVTRYSYLDVRDRGLGSKASVTTLGLNYYYKRHIKVMLAYLHPDISGSVRHDDPEGDAVASRGQLLF